MLLTDLGKAMNENTRMVGDDGAATMQDLWETQREIAIDLIRNAIAKHYDNLLGSTATATEAADKILDNARTVVESLAPHPAANAQGAVQSDPFAKDRAEVAEALEVWAKALRHNRRSDSDAVLLDEAATLLRRHPALSSPGQLARLREDPGPLGSAVCYIDNVMNRLGGSEVTLPRAEAEALLAYLDSHPHGFESGGQRGLTEAESEMLRDKYRGMFTEQRGTVTLEQLKKWPDELDETLRAEYPDGTTHFKSGLATAIDRLEEMIEALDGSSLSGRGSTQ
jgi:hypothetical protein